MKNDFTLLYFVNSFRAKKKSTCNLVDDVVENSLTGMVFEPSKRSIKNILDFARSYEVIETKKSGHIEMNLN
jgi:hypothetical protein